MKKTLDLSNKKKKSSFFNKGFLFSKSSDVVSLNAYNDLSNPKEPDSNVRRIGMMNRKKSAYMLEKNPIYEEIIIQHDAHDNLKFDPYIEETAKKVYFSNEDDVNSLTYSNSNSNNNASSVSSLKAARTQEEELKEYDVFDYSAEQRASTVSEVNNNLSIIDTPAPKKPSTKKNVRSPKNRSKLGAGNRRMSKSPSKFSKAEDKRVLFKILTLMITNAKKLLIIY
jgi:hypothetical protein